ncbi:chlorophyll a-b binding protein CP29.3, chloroplastic [Cannabis sativa]|uniref:Chlorophyll a-b binding protein, chloroplastic n=1 Tax=Cannabis sativa TaxID=3483 RepID=A0A7J6GTJ9_CANSA|nr:chlorophyll a-b binding protein CP29.3, chloroplastic [Cannabis sativa]KAF4353387.1 hypothetical protein G4B88_007169 [Cannabis sativa]KAF4386101.1 hypothetical protein F8388_016353 [Cannabis sativa]KAF4395732.1 hypothetical protein G4B88_013506 [Cannabis sativa]
MATITAASAASTSYFFGTRIHNPAAGASSGSRFQARFSLPFGKKKAPPPPPPPPSKKFSGNSSDDRLVWFPGAEAPEWLDGSMIGDRGFDPFGFAKPAEYLQYDYDGLDQNLAKNVAGEVIGVRVETNDVNPTPFQPYSEVFGIQRFRECELIHGRWAMLGVLGALSVEALTGVAWQDAGKVELIEGSSYLGQPLPFSLTTLIWIEVLVIGYIEFQRNAELDPEKRLYPGGQFFDPLGLAAKSPEEFERLQLAEIKHSRLAMIAFLIFGIQAAVTGKGPISFIATFTK